MKGDSFSTVLDSKPRALEDSGALFLSSKAANYAYFSENTHWIFWSFQREA
jgi:hypothetical protein